MKVSCSKPLKIGPPALAEIQDPRPVPDVHDHEEDRCKEDIVSVDESISSSADEADDETKMYHKHCDDDDHPDQVELPGEAVMEEVEEKLGLDVVNDDYQILVDIEDPKKAKATYGCNVCGKFYSNTYNLKNHINASHLGIKFECGECGYKTSQKKSLDRHILAIHRGHKFVCAVCQQEFSWETDLRRHVISKHTDSKFKCDICEDEYSERRTLSNHKRIHHSSQPYVFKCHVKDCKFESTEKVILDTHKRNYHEFLLHKCQHCNYSSLKKTEVSRHNLRKHGAPLKYECEMCEIKFSKKADYDMHQEIHVAMRKKITAIKKFEGKVEEEDGKPVAKLVGRKREVIATAKDKKKLARRKLVKSSVMKRKIQEKRVKKNEDTKEM